MTASTSDRQQLLARKTDLYHAIEVLDRDRADGTIDPDSYQDMRRQYELEAAGILEQLDRLPVEGEPRRSIRRPWLTFATLGIVVVAVAVILIGALHGRSGTQAITGDGGQAAMSPVQVAQAQVKQHPTSYIAYLRLGQADQNAKRVPAAERAYRQAMILNPRRPEAPTLEAMILIANGRRVQAMRLLTTAKNNNPSYARAWLLDGLAAAHDAGDRNRAIRDFKTFLRLQPKGAVAATVRQLLAAEQKVK